MSRVAKRLQAFERMINEGAAFNESSKRQIFLEILATIKKSSFEIVNVKKVKTSIQ